MEEGCAVAEEEQCCVLRRGRLEGLGSRLDGLGLAATSLGIMVGVVGLAEMLLSTSTLWLFLLLLPVATPSPDARRLYDDLLSNYNR